MIVVPVLFLAAFLWTVAVGPAPEVLCGCTEVLKNFA
jgi:hypothetical protein